MLKESPSSSVKSLKIQFIARKPARLRVIIETKAVIPLGSKVKTSVNIPPRAKILSSPPLKLFDAKKLLKSSPEDALRYLF